MVSLVKATPRNKKGTLSFTIPVEVVENLKITKGDKFLVTYNDSSSEIKFRRVT